MGHASEAMTALYLDGHELPWTEVSAGLPIGVWSTIEMER